MDLQTAQRLYDAALLEYEKALSAASYSIGGRSKSNHQIDDLWNQVQKWDRVVHELMGNGGVLTPNWNH